MSILQRFRRPAVPIHMEGDCPNEHNILSVKERYGSVSLLLIANRELIPQDEELYRQIGSASGKQVMLRQALLDSLVSPNFAGQSADITGYMFGRYTKDGSTIVDGVIFPEDLDPALLRLDPTRTVEGVLEKRLRTLKVTLVGTLSYASYADGVITEHGASEKKIDMPHVFILDSGQFEIKDIAIVTPVDGGGVLHEGFRIVEHSDSTAWGLVTSVQEVREPPIDIRIG